MKVVKLSLAVMFLFVLFTSCVDGGEPEIDETEEETEEVIDEEPEEEIEEEPEEEIEEEPEEEIVEADHDHPFTFTTGVNSYRFEANGQLQEGNINLGNSLEKYEVFVLKTLTSLIGSFNWIPLEVGTSRAGKDLGSGVGTLGDGNLFTTAEIKYQGKNYYAFSSHVYGFLEEKKIPNSSFVIKLLKVEGEKKSYRQCFGSIFCTDVTQFIGVIEATFSGKFISEDGEILEVTKGEFRIENILPQGVVILE